MVDRSGDKLVEPARLEDINPGRVYYLQQVWKPNEFHPTTFDSSVSWSTIEEIHKTGRIWQLIQE